MTVLTLASSSPRRRELMAFGGWRFDVRPVSVDETPRPGEPPLDYVLRMAVTKACAASALLQPGGIAVGADTTVVVDGDILGKPADPEEAAAMLRRLRGRTHAVHTAIAVLPAGAAEPETDLCTTLVPMRAYSEAEIAAYVASGDPFDKAGGYAIQNAAFRPVESISGCYANVVGLPVCHLVRTLRRAGVETTGDVPGGCRRQLGYDCSVHPAILAGAA